MASFLKPGFFKNRESDGKKSTCYLISAMSQHYFKKKKEKGLYLMGRVVGDITTRCTHGMVLD